MEEITVEVVQLLHNTVFFPQGLEGLELSETYAYGRISDVFFFTKTPLASADEEMKSLCHGCFVFELWSMGHGFHSGGPLGT